MNKQQEKQLSKRVVELGKSGDAKVVKELIQLTKTPSFHVKCLAISALGKLAKVADSKEVVPVLSFWLRDSQGQVRQYAIKSLAAFGADSAGVLHDIRDIASNPAEKDYNRKDAKRAVEIIEEAVRIKNEKTIKHCQKCNVIIESDEYARSMRAFQRPFCDKCFDEVYIRRRNYDTKVEINKNIRTNDGTFVQSDGERKITEWLAKNKIKHRYDERFRIIDDYAIRPDFYLPEFDIYIEYWGMDTIDYNKEKN